MYVFMAATRKSTFSAPTLAPLEAHVHIENDIQKCKSENHFITDHFQCGRGPRAVQVSISFRLEMEMSLCSQLHFSEKVALPLF